MYKDHHLLVLRVVFIHKFHCIVIWLIAGSRSSTVYTLCVYWIFSSCEDLADTCMYWYFLYSVCALSLATCSWHFNQLENRICRQIQDLHASFGIKERRKHRAHSWASFYPRDFLPHGLEIELIFALRAAVSEIRADFKNYHIGALNLPQVYLSFK